LNLSRAGGGQATRPERTFASVRIGRAKMKAERNSTNGSGEISDNPLSDGSLKDTIRKRAYELYLERPGGGGNELEDWLRAEAEVVWKFSH